MLNLRFCVRAVTHKLSRSIREAFGMDALYGIGRASITLPAGHRLPTFQSLYPDYDRFLPHLAGYLPTDSVVIDVGANVGDTTAAMVSANPAVHYLCIEGDDFFFGYLLGNIERLRTAYPGVSIEVKKVLVGSGGRSARLEGVGGTKHIVLEDGGPLEFEALDSLMMHPLVGKVSLLKSDVDGFDYDVINSGRALILRDGPLVYFECQIDTAAQLDGFRDCIRWLSASGYAHFAVFDNYGALIGQSMEANSVIDLIETSFVQKSRSTRRSIYYFDILGYLSGHADMVRSTLAAY